VHVANRPGYIDAAEMAKVTGKTGKEAAKQIAAADTDGDGRLDAAELKAGHAPTPPMGWFTIKTAEELLDESEEEDGLGDVEEGRFDSGSLDEM
jgi:hypothetical protein